MSWKIEDLEQTLLIGSTLVEGSTLSNSEAKNILAGKTVQGHTINEIRELLNYRTSVEWLIKQLAQSPHISTSLILDFHKWLFQGFAGVHGVWKAHQNYTYLTDGSRFDYLHPAEVDKAMRAWVEKFNKSEEVEVAAELYFEFERIHPFEDGNGRIGRILIAYWLYSKTGLNFRFYLKDKVDHLKALEAAGKGDIAPLANFFKKRTTRRIK